MDEAHGMDHERISVLLCGDMKEFRDSFFDTQQNHFRAIEWCQDIHLLIPRLRAMNSSGKMPDLLLLDLFSRKADVPDDDGFRRARQEVDHDVKEICQLLIDTGEKARRILAPQGIRYLDDIRREFPEYRLPILLYSRLGPYLLDPEESAIVDRCNAEFLLKWLDPDEQCRRIYRFHGKWRSQRHPIALEISRKLSTLPAPLANAVAVHLKNGEFEAAVGRGSLKVTGLLRQICGSHSDGGALAAEARAHFIRRNRKRAGEEDEYFRSRVRAVCDLYRSVFVLKRNFFAHNTLQEQWREADMCLSIYNMVWREAETLR